MTIKIISHLILAPLLGIIISNCTTAQPKTVLSAYLDVKDALVQTNSKAAGLAAEGMLAVLKDKTDAHSIKLIADAKVISESDDVSVQRKHFDTLSQNMYDYVQTLDKDKSPIYKQYCPMAFGNTGAFWLASEKEINNPYFGDKMLHCGYVKEEL